MKLATIRVRIRKNNRKGIKIGPKVDNFQIERVRGRKREREKRERERERERERKRERER